VGRVEGRRGLSKWKESRKEGGGGEWRESGAGKSQVNFFDPKDDPPGATESGGPLASRRGQTFRLRLEPRPASPRRVHRRLTTQGRRPRGTPSSALARQVRARRRRARLLGFAQQSPMGPRLDGQLRPTEFLSRRTLVPLPLVSLLEGPPRPRDDNRFSADIHLEAPARYLYV